VSAASLGISRPMVGVILSLNRWVRLITNPIAARLYERFPAGALILVAIVLSALSTAMYALPAALAVFLVGRLLWGFCYSLLRLGSFLAALEDAASHAGRRIGNTRAVWGIGYFAGAVFAPFAIESIGWTGACVVAAALTLVAGIGPAYVASNWRRRIRVPEEGHVPASVWEPRLLALFVTATVQLGLYAGILVAAGGFRVDELFHDGAPIFALVVPATFVAAAFALTQRVAQVLWTPIAGRWSDRSSNGAFVISTLLSFMSVALLALLRPEPILFVVIGGFAFVNGLTTTIAVELAVSRRSRDQDRPRILAALHTWQDGGAATGALLGGVLAAFGASGALLVGAALIGVTLPLWWAAMRS
jgi:predicted MFS family arabinose efflux permease